jgi:hypothetical protein
LLSLARNSFLGAFIDPVLQQQHLRDIDAYAEQNAPRA